MAGSSARLAKNAPKRGPFGGTVALNDGAHAPAASSERGLGDPIFFSARKSTPASRRTRQNAVLRGFWESAASRNWTARKFSYFFATLTGLAIVKIVLDASETYTVLISHSDEQHTLFLCYFMPMPARTRFAKMLKIDFVESVGVSLLERTNRKATVSPAGRPPAPAGSIDPGRHLSGMALKVVVLVALASTCAAFRAPARRAARPLSRTYFLSPEMAGAIEKAKDPEKYEAIIQETMVRRRCRVPSPLSVDAPAAGR